MHRHGVSKAGGRGTLAGDLDGPDDLVEAILANGAVVANTLHRGQPLHGGEGHLTQRGQVVQALADIEVAGVVDGGLGPHAPARQVRPQGLELLVEVGVLVSNVQ